MKKYNHCMKRGSGDYDVCHYGYDFCSCRCDQCAEAFKEELDRCKAEVQRLHEKSPEILQFILDNHESIAQSLKNNSDFKL